MVHRERTLLSYLPYLTQERKTYLKITSLVLLHPEKKTHFNYLPYVPCW